MIGLALVTLGALAVLGQADGQAVPDRAEVQVARFEFLNMGCGPGGDSCHHPVSTEVRRVRCTPRADNRVRCRFQERSWSFYDQESRWQRAEFDFVYDAAGARWTMDCRTESTRTPVIQIIRCN